jgi:RimJ/RimL family protein N-acetyltransferase
MKTDSTESPGRRRTSAWLRALDLLTRGILRVRGIRDDSPRPPAFPKLKRATWIMHSLPQLPPDSSSWIRTRRLVLEPMLRVHAEVMYPILSDPALYQFIAGAPPSSAAWLAEMYARQECRRSPDGRELWLNWLMRERERGTPVGYAQATIASAHTYVAWVVGTPWQGRGYASEAAAALVRWLEQLGAPDVRACIHPRHTASQGVAHHAGLRRTRQLCDGEEVWVARHAAEPESEAAGGTQPREHENI